MLLRIFRGVRLTLCIAAAGFSVVLSPRLYGADTGLPRRGTPGPETGLRDSLQQLVRSFHGDAGI